MLDLTPLSPRSSSRSVVSLCKPHSPGVIRFLVLALVFCTSTTAFDIICKCRCCTHSSEVNGIVCDNNKTFPTYNCGNCNWDACKEVYPTCVHEENIQPICIKKWQKSWEEISSYSIVALASTLLFISLLRKYIPVINRLWSWNFHKGNYRR